MKALTAAFSEFSTKLEEKSEVHEQRINSLEEKFEQLKNDTNATRDYQNMMNTADMI